MQTTALLLIDIQNDYFPNGLWEVPDMETASANAARVLAHARSVGQPVFHIRHEFPTQDAPFFRPGSRGAEIHSSVLPQPDEPVILKQRPNSFVGTGLQAQLDARGIKSLVLVGAMSQMCIDSTARAAVDLGYAVTILEDACAAKPQSFNGMDLSAKTVHAAIMAPLAGSFANVITCGSYISDSAQ